MLSTICQYGAYTFPLAPVWTIRREREGPPDEQKPLQAWRETAVLDGILTGTKPSLLKADFDAMEAAFQQDGLDLIVTAADGTILYQLKDADTLTGTHVRVPVSYPVGQGAEFATKRTFHIEVDGIVRGQLPYADASGSYTTSTVKGQDGQVIMTVRASYKGKGRLAAAQAAAGSPGAGWFLLGEPQNEDDPLNETLVLVRQWYGPDSRKVTAWRETVRSRTAFLDYVVIPVLNNQLPIKMDTVWRPFQWSQQGEATGRLGYAPIPAAVYSTPRGLTYTETSPERTADDQEVRYANAWEYSGESPTTPSARHPNSWPLL